MQKYYFNFYLNERRYGGPEEGGWWYDWYVFQTTLESRSFATLEEANDHAAELAAKIREEQEPVYHMGNSPHDGLNEAGEGDDRYLLPGGAWGEDEIYVTAELLPGKADHEPGRWDLYKDAPHLPVPVPQGGRPFYE